MLGTVARLTLIASLAACGKKDDEPPDPAGGTPAGTTTTAPGDPCAELGLTVRPWQDGAPETPALKALAGDFTLRTRGDPFTLSARWTGCDTYLFLRSGPRNWDGDPMWSRDHEAFLKKLPENTHVFFVSDDPVATRDELDLIEAGMNDAIRSLGPEKEAWWSENDRIHYVKDDMASLGNWVGEYLISPGWGFGIDRFQTIRDIGSLADQDRYNGSWYDGNLEAAANEAILYNFESDRQDQLDAQQGLQVVQLWDEVRLESGWGGADGYITVDIPAATAANADRLMVDMDMTCDGEGEYGVCPAWDRITTLFLCDQPQEATNPHEDEACQPYVAEVQGLCAFDGVVDSAQLCSTADTCVPPATGTGTGSGTGTGTGTGTGGTVVTCEGVVPAIPAATVSCPCEDVNGGPYDAVRSCEADGLGYGACACGCGTEVSRWITTYHREGRWVVDADFALPWFERGGEFRFRYASIDPYVIDLALRFYDSGASDRPATTLPLFDGGSFGPAYNTKYAPIDAPIPASATKVELAVLVTGHGMEMPGNCAEFCDTQHHFGVNGTDNLVSFPYLTSQDPEYWCENMVDEGTIPNQYGTWFFSRSNWCPGKEVDPVVIDVTDQVTPGQVATFTYAGDRNGAPYHSDGAYIDLSSYLVIHE